MNNLRLDLWKEEQRIKVQAVINLREITDGAFSFYLGSGYTIQSMTDGFGQLVEYVQEEQVTGWAPYCFWQLEIPQFGSLKLHSILSISFRVLLLVGLITTLS